ncbi:MAG: M14 family metallopeptidase [Bacteroidota bacterium]
MSKQTIICALKKIFLKSFFFFLVFTNQGLQAQDLKTLFEKTDGKQTPRYDETVTYCKQLAATFPIFHFTEYGKSSQGRALPLLIADRDGIDNPSEVREMGRIVVLIQACIHAGEPDGKDAGLMLMRDLATNKEFSKLLEHVTVLFIPIVNVDGHERWGKYNRINQNGPEETGWRATAQNLNLNRDFMKADAPETQAWLKLFNHWLPDFFIDSHVTDGADFQYTITYGLELMGNMEPTLTQWTKNIYLKKVDSLMRAENKPITPYVEFRNWHDPRSGLESFLSPPMLSQGYTAIQNRPGLLIESHMLKDYKTRVNATYAMLKNSLLVLDKNYLSLIHSIANSDVAVASADFRKKPLPVNFETGKDSVMVDFLGVEYSSAKSALTGGMWFTYSKIPKTFRIAHFNTQIVTGTVSIPDAYVIGREWSDVIERLEWHGIQLMQLKNNVSAEVNFYRLKNIRWSDRPYEGRQKIISFLTDTILTIKKLSAGDVVIRCDQRTAKVIAYLMEPGSSDSFLRWGFFNTQFQQKEYSESYVMEGMARDMLAKDPALQKEFDAKKASDTVFAKNPNAILNWFYSKTPYWDNNLNVVPIYKIYGMETVKMLPCIPYKP